MQWQGIRSWLAALACTQLAGCASIVGALFGQGVDVSRADASPPSVRIVVPDTYVRSPAPGDFVVAGESASAWVHAHVGFSAIAEDMQGVRFVEILDIRIEPSCAPTPVSRDGRPPAPPTFLAAPPIVLPGTRIEVPASSMRATTRLPVFRSISLTGGDVTASRWCPPDRPLLGNAVARVRARAANFDSGVSETATASLSLAPIRTGGSVGGGVIGSSGGSGSAPTCAGAGTACMTQPAECFGRGPDWRVAGTIECRGSTPVCVATNGSDYCTSCGGDCGACAGQSCSATAPCAPGAICAIEPRLGGSVQRCRSLLVPETSTGNRPCTPISGFCWLPSEAGRPELICSEGAN